MGIGPDRPEGITEETERILTLLGLLSFAVLVAAGCLRDLVIRLFSIHPAVSICLVFAGLGLAFLALYGLGNSWRLLRRDGRGQNPSAVDLGWGGAMGHYMESEDDTSGKSNGGG